MKQLEVWESSKRAYLLIGPGALLFLFFYFYPYIYSISLSLTNQTVFNLISGANFIGINNYKYLFNINSPFYIVLSRTLIWVCTSVFIKVFFGLAFAFLFNSELVRGETHFTSPNDSSLGAPICSHTFNMEKYVYY